MKHDLIARQMTELIMYLVINTELILSISSVGVNFTDIFVV